jgi:hypothetical protein
MSNIGLSDKLKKGAIPFLECHDCKRRLEEGEWIAVIGKAPPDGLSMPLGRADAILKKIGNIYCEKCYRQLKQAR